MGCSHILAIVTNAAVNMGCRFLFNYFEYISRNGVAVGRASHLLGRCTYCLSHSSSCLFLIFWGTSLLLPTVTAACVTPTSHVQGFQLLYTLTTIHYFYSCQKRCGEQSHCVLICISQLASDGEYLCIRAVEGLVKHLFKSFVHFLRWGYLGFTYWVVEISYRFWILTYYQINGSQIFSFHSLSLFWVLPFPCGGVAFAITLLVYVCFVTCAFVVKSRK
jgi:hypothetical protein